MHSAKQELQVISRMRQFETCNELNLSMCVCRIVTTPALQYWDLCAEVLPVPWVTSLTRFVTLYRCLAALGILALVTDSR
jgi:hypothetical protein